MKEALEDIGITVDLRGMLFNEQWAKSKGPAKDRQDIFEMLWWPGYAHGYDTLYSCFHSESSVSWNLSYWYNKEYDKLIDTAYATEVADPAKAQDLYDQAQKMLVDQAPAVYVFDPKLPMATLPNLKLDSMARNPFYSGIMWYHVSH